MVYRFPTIGYGAVPTKLLVKIVFLALILFSTKLFEGKNNKDDILAVASVTFEYGIKT